MFIKRSLALITQAQSQNQIIKNFKNISVLQNKFFVPFSSQQNNQEIKVPESISYPDHTKLFPEGLTPEQLEIPKLDKKLFAEVFGTDLRKPVEQRAAYFKQSRNGKTYHVFDASKIPLGRMCQQISLHIRGKNKPTYKYNRADCGDRCIIINAGDIFLTGKKALNKKVIYHTGFVGHLKEIEYKKFLLEKPEQLIIYIISKQLPKNLLRKKLLKKVDIYRGAEHDMLDKFPNFVPPKPKYDYLKDEHPAKLALRKDTVITYTNDPENIPEEFKHLKHEQDAQIEIPFEDRNQIFKMTPHNKQVQKEWRQYYHKAKRYVVHKPKPYKSRRPDIEKDDLHVTSQKQISRWGIDHLIEKDDSREIEDESTKEKNF